MSGPTRDLALVDHWNASLERSLQRRERAPHKPKPRHRRPSTPAARSALLAAGDLPRAPRDLAELAPWELSLGRSRARRRAAELQFVPASSRAKRISLGALVAFSVGPTASVASGQSAVPTSTSGREPTTTTEHAIVLLYGSEGRQVKLLQNALGGIKVDGVFGPETEAAVRAFQTAHNLKVDGVVGPQTGAALRAKVAAEKTLGANVASVMPEPSTLAVSDVSAGGTSAPTDPTSPEATVTEDASTSPATSTGTSPATSTSADPATSTEASETTSAGGVEAPSLEEPEAAPATGDEASESQSGAATETPAVTNQTAQPSSEGSAQITAAAVRQLQSALHLPVDGIFGPETETAVRRLQARHGLAVDGVVGPETWGVIGVHNGVELMPPASAVPKPAPEPAVKADNVAQRVGSIQAPPTGAEAVRWLQTALHVAVDGEFGPETEAAVRRLQARHGLAVDGVVGPATWALIGVRGVGTLLPPRSALVQQAPADTTSPSVAGAAAPSSTTTSAGYGASEGVVQRVIDAGDEIATRPYVYGGGHGSFQSYGYDCSGSVSYALHGGGLLASPEDSGELESYGEPGPGRYITIYANAEHAWMVVDGKRFDTVALAETGDRWSSTMASTAGFIVRHPAGL